MRAIILSYFVIPTLGFVSPLLFQKPSSQEIVSFLSASPSSTAERSNNTSIQIVPQEAESTLQSLCRGFGASPENLLSLQSSDGERGVFLNKDIKENKVILRMPLKSCIRDDKPPIWYQETQDQISDDSDNPHHYNPSEWATRLAASLVDLKINTISESISAKKQWFEMLPDSEYLRASLPVHWDEEILANAKCMALEIATDTSYFSRAEAVSDLIVALQSSKEAQEKISSENLDLQLLCNDMLDLVQTRSCRVERIDGVHLCPPLRVLAPVFDFINHGSSLYDGKGSSNAYFGLEGSEEDGEELCLVIRARRNIKAKEEVLIDYGDSARPAWRCLSSYGFVPNYRASRSDGDESVAEVFYDGGRYEVSSHTVPTELVEAAYAAYLEEEKGASAFEADVSDNEPENILPPEVALRIAKRLGDAAFDLLIDHPEEATVEDSKVVGTDAEDVAKNLASSLRWSQHQVLLDCCVGLRDYAADNRR